MGCVQCCEDEFRVVVIGSASSGVTTTIHAITSHVLECYQNSNRHNARKTNNSGSSTTTTTTTSSPAAATATSGAKSNSNDIQAPFTSNNHNTKSNDNVNRRAFANVLITPSVALRIHQSIPFCIHSDGNSSNKNSNSKPSKHPSCLVLVDAGPVTHPGYRESVQLSQQFSHCNGVIIVIDATKSLMAQKTAKVMEFVAAGIRPNTPVFILVNKYDVDPFEGISDIHAHHHQPISSSPPDEFTSNLNGDDGPRDLIVPQDILHARFPLLISTKCRTPWRCLPGAARDPAFDPTHILDFLVDPSGIDQNANVILMRNDNDDDEDDDDDNEGRHHHENVAMIAEPSTTSNQKTKNEMTSEKQEPFHQQQQATSNNNTNQHKVASTLKQNNDGSSSSSSCASNNNNNIKNDNSGGGTNNTQNGSALILLTNSGTPNSNQAVPNRSTSPQISLTNKKIAQIQNTCVAVDGTSRDDEHHGSGTSLLLSSNNGGTNQVRAGGRVSSSAGDEYATIVEQVQTRGDKLNNTGTSTEEKQRQQGVVDDDEVHKSLLNNVENEDDDVDADTSI